MLVFPENMDQLEMAVIFKLFEKIYETILSIFGKTGEDIDGGLAGWFKDLAGRLDQTISGK